MPPDRGCISVKPFLQLRLLLKAVLLVEVPRMYFSEALSSTSIIVESGSSGRSLNEVTSAFRAKDLDGIED